MLFLYNVVVLELEDEDELVDVDNVEDVELVLSVDVVELVDDNVEDVELVLSVDVVELVDAIHSVTYSAAANSSSDNPEANMPIIRRMLLAFPIESGSIR